MSRITKLELSQLLATRNAEVEALRVRNAELEGTVAVLRLQLSTPVATPTDTPAPAQTPRPLPAGKRRVYEFDPAVPGDYMRAQTLARANHGLVRRAAQ